MEINKEKYPSDLVKEEAYGTVPLVLIKAIPSGGANKRNTDARQDRG